MPGFGGYEPSDGGSDWGEGDAAEYLEEGSRHMIEVITNKVKQDEDLGMQFHFVNSDKTDPKT